MIRTVWLTVLCLSGAVGAVAIGAGTSTPPSIVAAPPEQPVADEISSQDTLTEADRQEIAYVRDALAAEPAVAVANAPGETPPQPAEAKPAPRIVKRHRHDPNATKSATASTAPNIKRQDQKQADCRPPETGRRPQRVSTPGGICGALARPEPHAGMRHVVG